MFRMPPDRFWVSSRDCVESLPVESLFDCLLRKEAAGVITFRAEAKLSPSSMSLDSVSLVESSAAVVEASGNDIHPRFSLFSSAAKSNHLDSPSSKTTKCFRSIESSRRLLARNSSTTPRNDCSDPFSSRVKITIQRLPRTLTP